ncbi:hypothetical protein Pth03_58600 [Planotetraspora thailandica]|uniref:Uncharacterized protein n=1 Tax=Planotetraspora thailandica TaxID=487172 RepID=A0A8J3XYN2_9ACTN|nr:hypothetical protein [Planotetraspora thailandica]GII57471.1 hypothetical protein Pth03_58600 [Planotetraspora thailandica]
MYKLVVDPIAEEQTAALPDEALRPLAELFTLLETAPWSGEPYNAANPKANMLTHAFGERGLATYIVLEDQRETYLVRIEWP